MRIFLIFFTFLFISNNLSSQNCKDFYLKCDFDEREYWSINELSSSFNMSLDSFAEIEMEIFKAKDYRISICGDDIMGNNLHFTIFDTDDNLLYDNGDDDNALIFSFSCTETQNIRINLETNGIKSSKKGCLGILIQETLTIKTGF